MKRLAADESEPLPPAFDGTLIDSTGLDDALCVQAFRAVFGIPCDGERTRARDRVP